jgi:hypothetical protein
LSNPTDSSPTSAPAFVFCANQTNTEMMA